MKWTKETIVEQLPLFTGTEYYYRINSISRLKMTDGCKFVAETCSAYWLFDIISSVQIMPKLRNQLHLTYRLQVTGNKAQFIAEDGNHNKLYIQKIPFTDFPLESITLWQRNDVVMLPTEY